MKIPDRNRFVKKYVGNKYPKRAAKYACKSIPLHPGGKLCKAVAQCQPGPRQLMPLMDILECYPESRESRPFHLLVEPFPGLVEQHKRDRHQQRIDKNGEKSSDKSGVGHPIARKDIPD